MGGRAGGGAAGGMGSGSRGLERALSARMKEIQNSYDEHVSIFDKNGKEVFRADGDDKHVEFDDALAANRVTVHNHPGSSTFSYGDIETAISTNQSEMHVITQSGIVYSLKRPQKGWGIKASQLHDINNKTSESAIKKIDKLVKSGKNVSMDEATHIQWQTLSKKMGWSYTKSKL